jgi:hypothetical protein
MRVYRRCEVKGCKRKHLARGMCNRHYRNWQRYGNPTVTKKSPRKFIDPTWNNLATWVEKKKKAAEEALAAAKETE